MTTTENTIVDGAIVATVDEMGKVKPIVIMLDELLHTAANGYQCGRRDCPCYLEAQERRERLPLNGNRPFSLLR